MLATKSALHNPNFSCSGHGSASAVWMPQRSATAHSRCCRPLSRLLSLSLMTLCCCYCYCCRRCCCSGGGGPCWLFVLVRCLRCSCLMLVCVLMFVYLLHPCFIVCCLLFDGLFACSFVCWPTSFLLCVTLFVLFVSLFG